MPKINASREVLDATSARRFLEEQVEKFHANSMNDLAEMLRLEPKMLSDIAYGKRNLTTTKLVELARKFRVHPCDLLTAITGIENPEYSPLENRLLSLWSGVNLTTKEMVLSWLRDQLGQK